MKKPQDEKLSWGLFLLRNGREFRFSHIRITFALRLVPAAAFAEGFIGVECLLGLAFLQLPLEI